MRVTCEITSESATVLASVTRLSNFGYRKLNSSLAARRGAGRGQQNLRRRRSDSSSTQLVEILFVLMQKAECPNYV